MKKLFEPKKSLGQHFLKDQRIINRIVSAAKIKPGEKVLEIGAGSGNLSYAIIKRGAYLFAVELDERLIKYLQDRFVSNDNVEIIKGDGVSMDFDAIFEKAGEKLKVVANLPYQAGARILVHLIKYRSIFKDFTLMFQKEVAQRITAEPGTKEYGFLSVIIQGIGKPHILFTVPASAFYPCPKVESAVISLIPFDHLPFPEVEDPFFYRVVRAAFSSKRKTLLNSLNKNPFIDVDKDLLIKALKETKIDFNRRGETLSVEEFARLTKNISILTKKRDNQ